MATKGEALPHSREGGAPLRQPPICFPSTGPSTLRITLLNGDRYGVLTVLTWRGVGAQCNRGRILCGDSGTLRTPLDHGGVLTMLTSLWRATSLFRVGVSTVLEHTLRG